MKYNKTISKKAIELAKTGLSNKDISKSIGIKQSTLYSWFSKYKSFKEEYLKAKSIQVEVITNALFESAKGYYITLTKIITHPNGTETKEITEKYYPPNPASIKFYLINNDKENYKPNSNLSNETSETAPKPITIEIVRGISENDMDKAIEERNKIKASA